MPMRNEVTAVSRREPLERVVQAVDVRRAQVTLNVKILAGYVVLGLALIGFFIVAERLGWDWTIKGSAAGLLTLVLAIALPSFLLRVSRVQRLSSSALEISRGDLSSRVVAEPGSLRDDIDELSVAISNMQENLRELVSHISNTAQL